MNKLMKSIIATLGAINVVVDIFLPITVGLISISFFDLTVLNTNLVILLTGIASVYRGIKVGVMK